MCELGYSLVLHVPLAGRLWPRHKTSRLNLILILSLSLRDYYPETAQKPMAMTSMQLIWASMRWGGAYNHHLTLLSWFAVSTRRGEICRAMFLCRGSLWGDWALARREKRRGDPGPCVSAHPAAVTRGSVPDSAWCLLGQLSPLDVETSRARPRAQHSSHFHLSSLAGRCHKNQILRQDF